MTTTEIFLKMVYWLVDNTEMANPTAVARKAGINAANVTKIKTGKNKSVQYETMVKLNNAFGNVFNPEWMRGKSDVMLVADLAPVSTEQSSTAPQTTDPTAALIAAKDEIIASLKREITAKNETIATLNSQLNDKEKLISILQNNIDEMNFRNIIEKGDLKNGISSQQKSVKVEKEKSLQTSL